MVSTSTWLGAAALGGACLLAVIAMYEDWRRREIPHWVVAGLVTWWIMAAWVVPSALDAARWTALVCGVGGLAAGYGFHALGWLGGGDGKLLAVLALWLGPKDLGLWLLGTAALGLLLSLLTLSRPTGDFRTRGIPFAWAMVPPAATLLIARAAALSGG